VPDGGGGNAGTGGAVAPQGDPPILDALNMVQSAQATGGFYTITGYITFHTDDSYVVTTVLVDVPVIGKTITVPEPSLATAYGLYFSFQLPDQVPLSGAGATTYIVTLVTNGGAQSTPADESVVLL